MSGKSQYLETSVLQLVLLNNVGGPSSPANVYAALLTTLPTSPITTPVSWVEVTDAHYVRRQVTFGSLTAPPANGLVSNSGASIPVSPSPTPAPTPGPIEFFWNVGVDPYTPGAIGGYTVVGVAIFDSSSGPTNLLYYGPLGAPKTVASGDQISFSVGTLTIQEG